MIRIAAVVLHRHQRRRRNFLCNQKEDMPLMRHVLFFCLKNFLTIA
jgi:hypothetical protein